MLWIGVASLLLAVQATAAEPDPVTGDAPAKIINELTAQTVEAARANAGRSRLSDGSPLPAATEQDRQRFAVPAALERQTVRRGMLTGQLEHCGAEGIRQSYMPYMRRLRERGRYSEQQLAYVGFLHGIAQALTMNSVEGTSMGACSDAQLAGLAAAAQTETVSTP